MIDVRLYRSIRVALGFACMAGLLGCGAEGPDSSGLGGGDSEAARGLNGARDKCPTEGGLVVRGVVSQSEAIAHPRDKLRVAMVWWHNWGLFPPAVPSPVCAAPRVLSTQMAPLIGADVRLAGKLPARFELDLGDAPPEAALAPLLLDPSSQHAMGQLVVYSDENRNSRLDLASPGVPSPDVVLGMSSYWRSHPLAPNANKTSYELTYTRTSSASGSSSRWNLLRIAVDAQGTDTGSEVPLDTEIAIQLDQQSFVNTVQCDGLCINGRASECPATPAELPPGGERICRPATDQFHASFAWQSTSCDEQCNCDASACSYVLDPNAPPPAGWPCPLE